jgi:hypothetical protein
MPNGAAVALPFEPASVSIEPASLQRTRVG